MASNKKIAFGISLLVVFAALCFFLFSSRNTAPKQKEDLPAIIVGCDDYSPFSYRDVDGNMKGIDVEIGTEAFRRMGYKANFIFISWENKKFLLTDKKIDCIWSSFTMNGRESEYKWAGPYMKSHQVIAVTPESPIQKLSDLEGKVIAVQSATKPEDIFRRHDPNMPHFRRVISLKNRDLLYTFLSKGYADAIAAHDTSIDQFMEDFGVTYRILDDPLLTVGLGVAFDLHDERGLDKELTKTLQTMQKDGTIETIIGKYLNHPKYYLEDWQ